MLQHYYHIDDPNKTPVYILQEPENNNSKIYTLSNKQHVMVDVFFKKYAPITDEMLNESSNFNPRESDVIDVNKFLNSSNIGSAITDLKNVDSSKIVPTAIKEETINHVNPFQISGMQSNTPTPEPQQSISQQSIQQSNPEYEIELQYENEKEVFGEQEASLRKKSRLRKLGINQSTIDSPSDTPTQQPAHVTQILQQIDPATMLMRSFKRNHPIEFNFTLKEKIANPDFIKMMMENIEGDVIGFYKNLIMDSFMNDMVSIEKQIEDRIRLEIYGEEPKKRKNTRSKSKNVE